MSAIPFTASRRAWGTSRLMSYDGYKRGGAGDENHKC